MRGVKACRTPLPVSDGVGGAGTAERNCSEGGRNTNKPLGAAPARGEGGEIDRRNGKRWPGMHHFSRDCIVSASAPRYASKRLSSKHR